jgi:hypothetical protein
MSAIQQGTEAMMSLETVMSGLCRRAFFGAAALLFVVSAALPFACCAFPSTAAMPVCGPASTSV